MRYLISFLFGVIGCCVMSAAGSVSVVKPGIETLRDNGFELLKGKRVGLITNPTGVDNDLKSTIDILHEAPGVNLVALFAPEHGVRGDIPAGQKVAVAKDAVTGVKVHSLYGATRRPTAEMLKDVDVLVYDIQDNGCRSYTFISTMGLAMEQCARLGSRPSESARREQGGRACDRCRLPLVCRPIPRAVSLRPDTRRIGKNVGR